MKYVFGIIAIITGVFMVLKTEWLVNNLGRISWADEHLGFEGGTRIFYKILGTIIILFSFLAMIGAFNGILTKTFGGAFQDSAQDQQQGDTLNE